MIDFKKIGLRIKKLRLKKAMTQESLAEKLNISTEHLSRIETGAFRPSLNLIEKISDELGSNEKYIMFGDDTKLSETQEIASKLELLNQEKLNAISIIIDLIQ